MKTKILALALALAPFAASAAPLSYTFVEGGYNRVHTDVNDSYGDDTTGDGAYLRGSYGIGQTGLNVFGNVGKVSDTLTGAGYRVDFDVRNEELGLGYHTPVTDRVDVIAEGAWVRQIADLEGTVGNVAVRDDARAHGGRAAVGFRGEFNDMVEGLVKANYYGGGDFEGDEFTVTGGLLVKFNPTWGVAAEIEYGDIDDVKTTRYNIGVRASF